MKKSLKPIVKPVYKIPPSKTAPPECDVEPQRLHSSEEAISSSQEEFDEMLDLPEIHPSEENSYEQTILQELPEKLELPEIELSDEEDQEKALKQTEAQVADKEKTDKKGTLRKQTNKKRVKTNIDQEEIPEETQPIQYNEEADQERTHKKATGKKVVGKKKNELKGTHKNENRKKRDGKKKYDPEEEIHRNEETDQKRIKQKRTSKKATRKKHGVTKVTNMRGSSKNADVISFTSFIEFDLHGTDPNIHNAFDFIPLIRDALMSALEQSVDMILFIPGKGIHSKKFPVLRPLVLLVCTRLHFTSFIDNSNRGVVVCLIDSYNKNKDNLDNDDPVHPRDMTKEERDKLLRDYGVFQDSSIGGPRNDETIEQKLAFWDASIQAVQNNFPDIPITCCEIIGALRTPKEAVRYAKEFEQKLDLQQIEHGKANLYDSLRDMNAKIMRITNKFERKYPRIEKNLITRVVKESLDKGSPEAKMESIFKKLNDLSIENLELFTDFALNAENETIKPLLDLCIKRNFNWDDITNELLAGSRVAGKKALGVMNVNPVITALRNDGRPKFIPSIEIDLTQSSEAKATRSIERIINGLADGNFSEMVLQFSPTKSKAKCEPNAILEFITRIAREKALHFNTRIEGNSRYHISIYGQTETCDEVEKDSEEEDYSDEEDDSDDDPNQLYVSLYSSYKFMSGN